jgi:hypothetical protein
LQSFRAVESGAPIDTASTLKLPEINPTALRFVFFDGHHFNGGVIKKLYQDLLLP